MTYQSSPYMPWIFPDEAYHMNTTGLKPLRPVPIKNGFDLLEGGGSEAQTLFDNHDRKVALDRVRYNKKKELGMLGHINTTARSQRYERPASRSDVPNGVFHGSPMEYVTSAGLRGGVITTKAGQEWLSKRLKQRAEEYGELSTGNFSKGPPARIDVSPFNSIDGLLQSAFVSLTTGSFSSGLNETLNQLIQAFIKEGAIISGRQLSEYAQSVGIMTEAARMYEGDNVEVEEVEGQAPVQRRLDAKKFFKLKTVMETLTVLNSTIREIARVIDQPQAARQQVMSSLASRLLGRQVAQYRPGERERPPAQVQLGQPPEVARDLIERPVVGEEDEEEYLGDLAPIGELGGLGRRRRHRRNHRF